MKQMDEDDDDDDDDDAVEYQIPRSTPVHIGAAQTPTEVLGLLCMFVCLGVSTYVPG